MSRVTVHSVWNDICVGDDKDKWTKAIYTPIVPRKMVEMIIEKCIEDYCSASNDGGMCYEASCIKDYAEKLLNLFEEGTTDGKSY